MMRPLSGIRVLDLSRLLPGPYATMILADLGADVIKIEDPIGGDYTRYVPPMLDNYGAPFAALNRGKKSITLNLKTSEGAALLRKLARTADVVVDQFRPGVLDKLGVGWSVLSEENPRLVMCAITGYGQRGPYRTRAGHDLNYIGLSGLLSISGQNPEHPQFPGGQVADVGGGSLFAVIGILAALHERSRTGKGQFVDTSMAHGSMAFITMHLAGYLADPASPPPGPAAMQLNGAYCCYFVYRTRDGKHVTLGALEPKFWDNFCRAIHRPDLAGQGFSPARAGTPVFDAVVAEFASRTQAEWAELNATFDFCCEPVLDFSAVRTHPQFAEMFFELPVGATSSPQIEVPLGLQGVTGRGASTPPNLGEHTASVLAEVGVDESVYADLKARGVV